MIIILDFDGTLGDSRSLIVRTMQQTITALGLPKRTDEECASMIGLPLKQTFTELIPMSDDMGNLCEATYTEIFTKNNVEGAVLPFPHVVSSLETLHRRGHILTIASSRHRPSLLDYVRRFGIEDYIQCIVSASDVEQSKPAPDMVLKILNETHGKAEEAIVVGDTRFDIDMGRNAGTRTCGVTYGNGTPEELSKADYIIDSFDKLLDITE